MRANKKGISNGLALFAIGNERENKALLVAESSVELVSWFHCFTEKYSIVMNGMTTIHKFCD